MYYLAKIQRYNNYKDTHETNYALTRAESMAAAVHSVVSDWGEKSIGVLSLGCIELDETLELTKEEFDQLWKSRGDGTL